MAKEGCTFCTELGDLQILPLRYAAVCPCVPLYHDIPYVSLNHPLQFEPVHHDTGHSTRQPLTDDKLDLSNLMPSSSRINLNLHTMRTMPKITDQNSENIHKVFHTVRPIRRGYLYVLLEYSLSGSKSKRWQAYTVATGGELSLFNADQPPPEIKDFTCDTEGHREQVSMIQIKNSTLVKDAWMLFTPDPLTLRMLALLKETLIYLTLRKPYDIIGFQSSPLR